MSDFYDSQKGKKPKPNLVTGVRPTGSPLNGVTLVIAVTVLLVLYSDRPPAGRRRLHLIPAKPW